jgi:hypothetical protein
VVKECSGRLDFVPIGEITVKGKSVPIKVFRPYPADMVVNLRHRVRTHHGSENLQKKIQSVEGKRLITLLMPPPSCVPRPQTEGNPFTPVHRQQLMNYSVHNQLRVVEPVLRRAERAAGIRKPSSGALTAGTPTSEAKGSPASRKSTISGLTSSPRGSKASRPSTVASFSPRRVSTIKKSGSSQGGFLASGSDRGPVLLEVEVSVSAALIGDSGQGDGAPAPSLKLPKLRLAQVATFADLLSRVREVAGAQEALSIDPDALQGNGAALYFNGTRCFLPSGPIGIKHLGAFVGIASENVKGAAEVLDLTGSCARLVLTVQDEAKAIQCRNSYARFVRFTL